MPHRHFRSGRWDELARHAVTGELLDVAREMNQPHRAEIDDERVTAEGWSANDEAASKRVEVAFAVSKYD